MWAIDFASFPDISPKLSPSEIESLNTIFNDINIVQLIQEHERSVKNREYYSRIMGIFGLICVVGILSLLNKSIFDFFDEILSANGFILFLFLLCVSSVITSFLLSRKKEAPYTPLVLPKVCSLIDEHLKSVDGWGDFPDLSYLLKEKILRLYDKQEFLGHFIRGENPAYRLDWVEIKNGSRSRQSRNLKIADDCFLLRATFHTNIPLTHPVLITDDIINKTGIQSITGMFTVVKMLFPWPLSPLVEKVETEMRNGLLQDNVQIDSVNGFEKLFDTYDRSIKNQDTAVLLSKEFCERLIQFVTRSEYKYEFLFTSDQVYIKQYLDRNHRDFVEAKYINNATQTFAQIEDFGRYYISLRESILFINDLYRLLYNRSEAVIIGDHKNTPF